MRGKWIRIKNQFDRWLIPSVRYLEYLAKILPRSCKSWQDLRRNPRFCQDFQDEIQDLTKKCKIDSKNIFVEHVVLD